MDKNEALKLALEILNAAYVPADLDEQREKAIAAIKQALEQPVQKPVLWLINGVVQASDIPTDYTGCFYTSPPAAQQVIPDAMTSADIQEHIEYVAGWNECRQAMLEMMK